MKKVLITGANSYIGESLETYLSQWADEYQVDTVDMIDGSWRQTSFAGYDVIFHVAGIAHADTGRVSEERKAFYYKINTELAIETALKAKAEGVRQFIFMSSASVFGDGAPIGKTRVITCETQPTPTNVYGESKLLAEKGILALQDKGFCVSVLRPPMIYGKGCKGNYPKLAALARKLPCFPLVHNQRSMIYIGNLCEFVRLIITHGERGIFHPQNAEFSNTSELVQMIADARCKKLPLLRGVGWALKLMSHASAMVNKAFGSFCYDLAMSAYKENYRIVTLRESIVLTESGATQDER